MIKKTLQVTGSSDHTAKLWDVHRGQIIRNYKGHMKAVTCVALNDSSVASEVQDAQDELEAQEQQQGGNSSASSSRGGGSGSTAAGAGDEDDDAMPPPRAERRGNVE